jgi:hypothetical protein
MECTCSCGATSFQTLGMPLFRFFCHCTICQRFNDAPFADILVFRAEDVALPPPGTVIFDTYRPPPNVQRGKCATCGQPAVTVFTARFLPRLVTVPRPMFKSDAHPQHTVSTTCAYRMLTTHCQSTRDIFGIKSPS